MNKAIRVVCAVALLLALPLAAFAEVGYMVAAKVWYATWNPYLIDMGEEISFEGWQYMKAGSGVMYGPSVAVMPDDRWSVSISYLYGILEADYSAEFSDTQYEYHYNGSVKTTRQDLDTAVSYVLNPSLKLFIGFKYQPAEIKTSKRGGVFDLGTPGDGAYVDESEMTFTQKNYAPGAGIGFSFLLIENLAFTLNLSMIYIWGEMDADISPTYIYRHDQTLQEPWTRTVGSPAQKFTIDLQGFGANVEPAFVALFGDNVIASVGFRLQYARMKAEVEQPFDEVSGNDYLYGTYLAVIYKI